MKRINYLLVSLILLVLTTASYNDHTTGSTPGKTAPNITLTADNNPVTLHQYRGQYVLLSFWRASDANSRQLCEHYAHLAVNKCKDIKITHVGINLNDDRALFNGIIAMDGLKASNQFNLDNKATKRVVNDYNLRDHTGTLLLDPHGIVVAVNPSAADIAAINS